MINSAVQSLNATTSLLKSWASKYAAYSVQLAALGCFITKPLPADELMVWLDKYSWEINQWLCRRENSPESILWGG